MSFITKFVKIFHVKLHLSKGHYKDTKPFNSQKWPRQNFSLQYHYNIKQASDENKGKYQLGIISWCNTNFSKVTS